MEDSTVLGLLDRVADYMIGKSYLGPVQGLLGEVRSLVGEEQVLGSLLIWLHENAHLTQYRFWSPDQNLLKLSLLFFQESFLLIYKNGGIAKSQAQKSLAISSPLKLIKFNIKLLVQEEYNLLSQNILGCRLYLLLFVNWYLLLFHKEIFLSLNQGLHQ